MIWKTKTHLFTATECRRTGRPCPALARLAVAISRAMAAAGPGIGGEFEIDGSSPLDHCPNGCTARFQAGTDRVRIFCGTDEAEDIDRLNRFADMLFDPDGGGMPSGRLRRSPCALLDATRSESRANAEGSRAAL